MVFYSVSIENPHRHFIRFEGKFSTHGSNTIQLQLPAWRPGRYELGNFSKNIRAWKATDAAGNALHYTKLNKDLWEVSCAETDTVVIAYEYYGNELNAGSSFLDESMLYLNPVNCFFYDNKHMDSPYEVRFQLPNDYEIACGMHAPAKHVRYAKNFDQLADCPLIASKSMKHLTYEASGILHHIWIQGQVNLNEERLLREFEAFSEAQIKLFGGMPCSEYHFLFHFPPFFVRHGVEHCNSTVIAMGPASEYSYESAFHDLLGISCHELFHTWNIKSIRPKEMMPYDFTQENYTRLGYVAEGVTTYYGDMLLWHTGAFADEEWFEVLSEAIQTYADNPGRFNLSVAESSWDTWLDGYGPGIPWRKVSIYNEGMLCALMCDLHILSNRTGQASLDDVMRMMYEQFGKAGKGYSEEDYRLLVEEVANESLHTIFDNHLHGTSDYMPSLEHYLLLAGLEIKKVPATKTTERMFGFGTDEAGGKAVVALVQPESPADKAQLWTGDEIVTINGVAPYKNFQHLMAEGATKPLELAIMRKGQMMTKTIHASAQPVMWKYSLQQVAQPSAKQEALLKAWKKRRL